MAFNPKVKQPTRTQPETPQPKRYPIYSGTLQGANREPLGQIVLWNNDTPTKETSPVMTGNLTDMNGNKMRISLWTWKPKRF